MRCRCPGSLLCNPARWLGSSWYPLLFSLPFSARVETSRASLFLVLFMIYSYWQSAFGVNALTPTVLASVRSSSKTRVLPFAVCDLKPYCGIPAAPCRLWPASCSQDMSMRHTLTSHGTHISADTGYACVNACNACPASASISRVLHAGSAGSGVSVLHLRRFHVLAKLCEALQRLLRRTNCRHLSVLFVHRRRVGAVPGRQSGSADPERLRPGRVRLGPRPRYLR